MNLTEYQQLARRTECDQNRSTDNIANYQPKNIGTRALHSIVGLAGELGELATTIERWLYYCQPLDTVNIQEEIGDCLWYLAEMCNCMGLDFQKIAEGNIAKLKRRYPQKYTNEAAKEENRNRGLEIQDLTKAETQVFTECVACSSGGKMCENQELPPTDAVNFVRKQTGDRTLRVHCPNCGGPLTQKACVLAAEGGRPLTCPNCMNTIDPATVRYGL